MSSHEQLRKLREPFPASDIGSLPKPTRKDAQKGQCRECGGYHGLPAIHLDYVGHAALTARFLDVDPEWTWEPVSLDQNGLPQFDSRGGLWIRLTICGVTRLGYGDADGKTGGNAIKEAIGDALRNAGMRFGAALELWHKGDLSESKGAEPSEADKAREALLETLKFKQIPPADASEKFAADGHGDLGSSADVAAIKALIAHFRGAA
ncbi:hypothetical protein [Rhodococcus rhodnii]|uniref:Uncharacterized protein n=1 Tax=Rhodococcus rhodnii LMG 5362 TaxID=1273125 RepID=R7WU30_9NOCA|nr:hypothetical protein [Rhodococcus rhodnii]EOM77664.1 hypothetical protein Rrhod_0983 [Rhodococcus rhodnii LMG 5362]